MCLRQPRSSSWSKLSFTSFTPHPPLHVAYGFDVGLWDTFAEHVNGAIVEQQALEFGRLVMGF